MGRGGALGEPDPSHEQGGPPGRHEDLHQAPLPAEEENQGTHPSINPACRHVTAAMVLAAHNFLNGVLCLDLYGLCKFI